MLLYYNNHFIFLGIVTTGKGTGLIIYSSEYFRAQGA